MKRKLVIASAVLALAVGIFAQEAQAPAPQTPAPQAPQEAKDAKYTNESVARLSFVEGKAFVQRASDLGYEEGALNMPISEGDRIGTSEGRVEVHFGRGNYIRLDNETKLDILNLPKKTDDIARFRVWSGNIFLVVGTLKEEKAIELHTADSSFYVLDRGVYRVDVRENKDTEIQVYSGLLEVAGEEGSTLLKGSQRLEVSEGRFTSKPSSFIAVANDGFDRFNESRTAATGRQYAQSRLPEELSDYEADLEEYGEWTYLPPYGNVWVPGGVDDEWRPYYDGRWTWLPLSGWTWWPYEPWGWATFHYGRWHWGVDFGWYWIPMNMWGPGWVNWWWDDWYFGWAPLSYWGYPGVLFGGAYYGHYYGQFYPQHSRALTVVRRDQLKDPHIARNALRGDSLKSLNRMSLTHQSLSLKPAGSKISVQPLDGNRVLLRNDGRGSGLTQDRRVNRPASGGAANSSGPRAIRNPDSPGRTDGKAKGTAAKPQSVKSPSGGEKKAASPKSSSSGAGKVQKKKDESPAAGGGAATATYRSDPSVVGTSSRVGSPKTAYGYPSSPTVKRPQAYGDSGRARARTFSGPSSRPSSSRGGSYARPSSGRSSGSTSSGSRARVGSSSSGRSSGASRGSSSRGSSGSASRGSSGGSRSSGGGVRRK